MQSLQQRSLASLVSMAWESEGDRTRQLPGLQMGSSDFIPPSAGSPILSLRFDAFRSIDTSPTRSRTPWRRLPGVGKQPHQRPLAYPLPGIYNRISSSDPLESARLRRSPKSGELPQ